MEPAYRDGSFDFIWRFSYLFSGPERGDVVAVKLAGDRVLLLKRVIALEGETVEFRDGSVYIDGRFLPEPYVGGPCNWNLDRRKVEAGKVYLVGDNRSMPIENHDFGQTSARRILGKPLW